MVKKLNKLAIIVFLLNKYCVLSAAVAVCWGGGVSGQGVVVSGQGVWCLAGGGSLAREGGCLPRGVSDHWLYAR